MRGRSIANFRDVDRYIIISYATRYIIDNYKFNDYLVGKGPDSNVEFGIFMEQYSLTIRNKNKILINKASRSPLASDTVSGKNFHNDFLRVFFHFGFYSFIFIRYTYLLFSYDMLYLAFYLLCCSLYRYNNCSVIIIVYIYKTSVFRLKSPS